MDTTKTLEEKKKREEKEELPAFGTWHAAYTTEDNLPPLERLIWELRGTAQTMYVHRSLLFWMLIVSLIVHAIR